MAYVGVVGPSSADGRELAQAEKVGRGLAQRGHVVVCGGLGDGLLVRSSDAVVSIGGSWGTLSEVALAVRTGVRVVAIGGWAVTAAGGREIADGPRSVTSVDAALALLDEWLLT